MFREEYLFLFMGYIGRVRQLKYFVIWQSLCNITNLIGLAYPRLRGHAVGQAAPYARAQSTCPHACARVALPLPGGVGRVVLATP